MGMQGWSANFPNDKNNGDAQAGLMCCLWLWRTMQPLETRRGEPTGPRRQQRTMAEAMPPAAGNAHPEDDI